MARKKKVVETEEVSEEIEFDVSKMRVIAPAGKPPFNLDGTEPEDIVEWAQKIASSGPYTMNAVIYWLRYFHETWSPEHKAIAKFLQEKSTDLGIPYIP